MHLFVDISSHGYGHLAITAPVLNRLVEMAPDLQLTVRSRLPKAKLDERIHTPFQFIDGSSDFGYVMLDATRINHAASAHAYRQAHQHWAQRVTDEARFLTQLQAQRIRWLVSENWPEQDYLIEWLQKAGNCTEISAEALENGQIESALKYLWQTPTPPRPMNSGDREAAQHLFELLH